MAIKKSELYGKLWKSCDALRGGMDASQYKDYILVLLFMRYVTDKYYGKRNALIEVPEGGSFHDFSRMKGDKEIGDKMNKAIRKMADANDLVGVITVADFNDADKLGKGKAMVDRLTELVAIFEDENLNFAGNHADGDDILGDAYEYLMKHFATESGKSKGQFYTPAEVSRIMAKVIGISKAERQDRTIYDPTCGSGSLLLKAADEAARGVTIYGQEKDVATVALAKMNMILHGNEIADIKQGDTLSDPEHKNADGTLKTFDYAVANPPFSTKSWSSGIDPMNDEFDRFAEYGIPPTKNGDYAFLLHFIKSLKAKGKGAIILPHGVLFRGNSEAEIRKSIIQRGYFKGIIGLPSNLFYGTGIPAAIILVDKENADARRGVFMVDASKGFVKDGNKNRLREQDVRKIVDVVNGKLEIPKFSRMVPFSEIEKNEYNLNIPRYIDNQEEEDIQDIEAHLLGGIPNRDIDALGEYWDVCPSLKRTLFEDFGRKGYSRLAVASGDIKEAILGNREFAEYSGGVESLIRGWAQKRRQWLMETGSRTNPREMMESMAEDMLTLFQGGALIDKYDIYQHLMAYWAETMKDDVYIIMEDGWTADRELVPEELVVERFFAGERETIERLEAEMDEAARKREEFEEEHGGEEGALEELKNDKGNITKAALKARIKEIKKEEDCLEELSVLKEYEGLVEAEAGAAKRVKAEIKRLDKLVAEKYKSLAADQIKEMVVDMKWTARIIGDVCGEAEKVSHSLASRVRELSERYADTLGSLEEEVKLYSDKVEGHLKRMGFAW